MDSAESDLSLSGSGHKIEVSGLRGIGTPLWPWARAQSILSALRTGAPQAYFSSPAGNTPRKISLSLRPRALCAHARSPGSKNGPPSPRTIRSSATGVLTCDMSRERAAPRCSPAARSSGWRRGQSGAAACRGAVQSRQWQRDRCSEPRDQRSKRHGRDGSPRKHDRDRQRRDSHRRHQFGDRHEQQRERHQQQRRRRLQRGGRRQCPRLSVPSARRAATTAPPTASAAWRAAIAARPSEAEVKRAGNTSTAVGAVSAASGDSSAAYGTNSVASGFKALPLGLERREGSILPPTAALCRGRSEQFRVRRVERSRRHEQRGLWDQQQGDRPQQHGPRRRNHSERWRKYRRRDRRDGERRRQLGLWPI